MNDNPVYYGLRDDYGLPRLEKALQSCPETIFVGHGPTFWAEISKDVPPELRSGYPKGPVVPGGAVPRLMGKYDNLWADISAGSGHNALTRDENFGIEFCDRFQDKLMFGTDACDRLNDAPMAPNVVLMRSLRTEKRLPAAACDKIAYRNAMRLLAL